MCKAWKRAAPLFWAFYFAGCCITSRRRVPVRIWRGFCLTAMMFTRIINWRTSTSFSTWQTRCFKTPKPTAFWTTDSALDTQEFLSFTKPKPLTQSDLVNNILIFCTLHYLHWKSDLIVIVNLWKRIKHSEDFHLVCFSTLLPRWTSVFYSCLSAVRPWCVWRGSFLLDRMQWVNLTSRCPTHLTMMLKITP